MKGAGMPNIALKPFCSSNIGMKPILMVDLFPPCVHSAVRLHRELLGAPNSRPCTKWRVMADTEESATVKETQDRSPSGKGFGSSSGRKGSSREKNKLPVVRRAPAEKPLRIPQGNAQSQQIETAFIISWAGLGILFLVEGIVLAASGFLPEEWDMFLVKYLYPSFTPTALLFLVGAVSYGLYKYLGSGHQKN